jgi:hypothetical protein
MRQAWMYGILNVTIVIVMASIMFRLVLFFLARAVRTYQAFRRLCAGDIDVKTFDKES